MSTNTPEQLAEILQSLISPHFSDRINKALHDSSYYIVEANNEIQELNKEILKSREAVASQKETLEAKIKRLEDIIDSKYREIIAASENNDSNSSETKQDQKVTLTFDEIISLFNIVELIAAAIFGSHHYVIKDFRSKIKEIMVKYNP